MITIITVILAILFPVAMICLTVLNYQRFQATIKTAEAKKIEENFLALTKELAKTQVAMKQMEVVLQELCKRQGIKIQDLVGK